MLITGKQVLEAFKSDLEGFFNPGAGFVMNTIIRGSKTHYSGSADQGGIVIATDIADFEVRCLEDFMLVLLVLGHEAAHLLNVHGGHKDQSDDETRALEAWADFFGAKVAMAVMTIGDKVPEMANSLGGGNAGVRLDAIGVALGRLATSYFDVNDPRYEPASVRVASYVAGVLSGLVANWRQHDVECDVSHLILAQMRIYSAPALKSLANPSVALPEDSQFTSILQIHQGIQGDRVEITDGMNLTAREWLRTEFKGSAEDYQARSGEALKRLEEQLAAIGLASPR